ncbi:MAG: efflux RND transporter periplasmic adaptor subunit [Planctomycetota bacterium]|jgi:multidrug efflux pump subunit AcrA (membrane-fusion protein)
MKRAFSTVFSMVLAATPIAVLSACSRDEPQAVLARVEDNHADDQVGNQPPHDLELATAGPGVIEVTSTFPGEIILNPDRMAHIVPRAAGIVREVTRSLGDYVEAGEVLAWVESDQLAEAKLSFYAKHAELGCCQIELPRAREIFENTNKLLTLLEGDPTPGDIRAFDGLEMGEYRGRLLTTYSEYLAAKRGFERERGLFDKNISAESELIAADAAFKKADANFAAARDIARYQVQVAYSEAARLRQVAEFEAVAAEQRLRLKGVDDEVVSELLALVPKTGSLEPCLCGDPNCADDMLPSVMQSLGNQERFGWYALRAPFAGFITEKHLTLGEQVGEDDSVMTIADIAKVWVRFNVYQKDLGVVKSGQTVTVDLGTGLPSARATISYVSPIVDKETRTSQARAELENSDGAFRPGLYATVHVDIGAVPAEVVIPRAAVQVLENEEVVFIEDDDGYEPVPVRLGRSDHDRVTVLAGLEPGQRFVEHGAFELKARIVTNGIDPHAGHGH